MLRVAPVGSEDCWKPLLAARRAGRYGALRRSSRVQLRRFQGTARGTDSCGASRTFICSSRALRRK
ncbi:hypothetical protein A2U01_0108362, partial [Trifolium medium]|nr:hypothetical protein [Trifolium medium]